MSEAHVLVHGTVHKNDHHHPCCPECDAGLYADSRPAFAVDWNGQSGDILYCQNCGCVWVVGVWEDVREEQRQWLKGRVLSDGSQLWPGEYEKFKRQWGEDV